MSDGFGAAFGAIALFAVLLAIAGLLFLTTGVALHWRGERVAAYTEHVALALVGGLVLVAGFAIVALADEAPLLAGLFAATTAVPVVLAAGRARWAGAPWPTVVARSGMAWCLPFLAGTSLLFVVATSTSASPAVATGVVGVVTTAGTLLCGAYLDDWLAADDDPPAAL